jgi:hypothetical protein
MIRTHEQYMAELDAILARYIAGGYEPETRPECQGCRVTLDNKLICCNPDAVAAHNHTNEGEGNVV